MVTKIATGENSGKAGGIARAGLIHRAAEKDRHEGLSRAGRADA
jgi:hypothetical protein